MAENDHYFDKPLAFTLRIPEKTPSGQMVTITEIDDLGVFVMHAESPDQSELYFEIAAYQIHREHSPLAQQQREYLHEQSAAAELTAIRRTSFKTLPATTFDFRGPLQGRLKVRRFIFVDGQDRTYRIVYDFTSRLNERLLDSLVLYGENLD